MSVQLNHTIVHVKDKAASARFRTELLDLPAAKPFGPFHVVEMENGVSLDFMENPGPIGMQHYAFLVTEDVFDKAFDRLRERGLAYWADPHKHHPGEINRNDGGRGVYFHEPGGHYLELLTVPYGGWKQ